jgi:hypothetical protein
MVIAPYEAGAHCPLRPDETLLLQDLLAALTDSPAPLGLAASIVEQAQNLDCFGALLARYPSPLEEQKLGGKRRGLDTLVESLCHTNIAGLTLRAPTQSIVGRALNLAQINFFRLLWHVCSALPDANQAARLRERTAVRLRSAIYSQLVEEVLRDLATDEAIDQDIRARVVKHLAMLWGHRLTWRVHEFFPVLEATWEARSRVRVIGGTLLGASELFQLLTQGADTRFVELLTAREHGELEVMAFREFLFGRSSEELERLTERMAREGLSSLELDSRMEESSRDTGSLFHEFFETRFLLANARRLTMQPGPRYTAEGYVVLAWLQQEDGSDSSRSAT